jgi:predicted nucleic acid-binding protein
VKILVLDTSAIIKWFVNEDESFEMRLIRDLFIKRKINIYIPSFLFIELCNALRYISGLNENDVLRALNALKSLRLNIVDDKDLLPKAIRIAYMYNITVYDALYIALAKILNAKLITYDKELLGKFQSLALEASKFLNLNP